MAESSGPLNFDEGSSSKPPRWGVIVAVAAVIGLIVLAVWIAREKKGDDERQAAVAALDKDLSADEEALKTQREVVMDLTKRVETLRASLQAGGVKDKKAAVAEFNKLAADQHAARDKFTQMADVYNKKVAKYKELQP
jgi:hypothetical protein